MTTFSFKVKSLIKFTDLSDGDESEELAVGINRAQHGELGVILLNKLANP